MICIEEDIPRLNKILADDAIYPFIRDDNTPEKFRHEMGEIMFHTDGIFFLSPIPESAFMVKVISSTTFEIHANVLPSQRGDVAVKAGLDAARWLFENTECFKLIAFIGTQFGNVCKFIEKGGFKQEGKLTKSLLLDGEYHDQYIYGLTKDELMEV